MQYVSLTQAYDYASKEAGLSREAFDFAIRPRLLERRYGERVVRLSIKAIDRAIFDPSYQEDEMKMLKRKTLKDALEHVWETEWQFQKGQRKQRVHIDSIIKDIGDRPAKKVTYNFLEKWIAEKRAEGLGDGTIVRRLSAIMKALKIAAIKGWIPSKPEKPPITARNLKDRYLSRDEANLLIDAAPGFFKWTLIVLLDTACRLSELTKVRELDITDDGLIFRDRKNGGNIKVPLSSRSRVAIRKLLRDSEWKALTHQVHDPVKDVRDRAIENASISLSKRFRRLADSLKLKDVSAHTLRHTRASWLAQKGYPMDRLQQFMGHDDINITIKRYAHLSPTSLKGALSFIEEQEGENVIPMERQRINDE